MIDRTAYNQGLTVEVIGGAAHDTEQLIAPIVMQYGFAILG